MTDQPVIKDKVAGYLYVGTNGSGEVIVNHPKMEVDEKGNGFLTFSPNQARYFAELILKHAKKAEGERN